MDSRALDRMWNAATNLVNLANAQAVRNIQRSLDRSLLAFESDDGGMEDVDGRKLSKSGWSIEDGRLIRPRQIEQRGQ